MNNEEREIIQNNFHKIIDEVIERDIQFKENEIIRELILCIYKENQQLRIRNNKLIQENLELQEAADKFWALEQAGVDNWVWYDEAMANYFNNEEE